MSDAIIVALAKEVTDAINKKAGSWSLGFTAERMYQPSQKLEDVDRLKVTVMLAAMRPDVDNRTEWRTEYDIDIGLMLRVSATAGDEAIAKFDTVLRLAEQLADYWMSQIRTMLSDCILINVQFGGNNPGVPYFPEHIQEFNTLTTVVRLTFQRTRDPSA